MRWEKSVRAQMINRDIFEWPWTRGIHLLLKVPAVPRKILKILFLYYHRIHFPNSLLKARKQPACIYRISHLHVFFNIRTTRLCSPNI